MTHETTITYNIVSTGLIAYRETVVRIDGRRYLCHVNVLLDNKIVKKIDFKTGEKTYAKNIGREITLEYLNNVLTKNNKNKKQGKTKENVNNTATRKVRMTIINEIGLTI